MNVVMRKMRLKKLEEKNRQATIRFEETRKIVEELKERNNRND